MANKSLHPLYALTPLPSGPAFRWWLVLVYWVGCMALFVQSLSWWNQPTESIPVARQAVSLLLLVAPVLLTWMEGRRPRRLAPASPEVLLERHEGRRIPPDAFFAKRPPPRFERGGRWLELRADGVLVGPECLLRTPEEKTLRGGWITASVQSTAGPYFVRWADIAAWEVREDDEQPDYYALALRSGGKVEVLRFEPKGGHEADILDAVRGLGQVEVRMFTSLKAK